MTPDCPRGQSRKDVNLTSLYVHIQRNTLLSIVSHTSLVTEEVECYNENARSNPIDMVGNPIGWWKQHGHHFPTLYRLTRRFLDISSTSCPVERLFSVAGQVDTARRSSLSPDTMTLLVFLYESLSLDRKIRSSRIVRTALED
jgi:hypothetical protein